MRWFITFALLLVLPVTAAAQDDKDRITRYLEETLSGMGREVLIEGFEGVLSSNVRLEKMTIADADGVWLTLEGAVLEWSRAAILRGEIDIDQISARRIEIARLPVSEGGAAPEAGQFALPELPVSIDIEQIDAPEVVLGETVIGVPVSLAVKGALTLEGGEGVADLEIMRMAGPRGRFRLMSKYANASRDFALNLDLSEAKDGIVATLLNLPGRPALELIIAGEAPIDDFSAQVALRSDGQPRLTGTISTRLENAAEGAEVASGGPRVIDAKIAGDLAPLFAPDYRPFFGPDVALRGFARLFPDGRVSVEGLDIKAAALRLTGALDLAPNGVPERFNLNALLEDVAGVPVLLPVAGGATRVERASVSAVFDARTGENWAFLADLKGLSRPELTLGDARITANGTITAGDRPSVRAQFGMRARALALSDEALAQAMGETVDFDAVLSWRRGEPLDVTGLILRLAGMKITGDAVVDGLESDGTVEGSLNAEIADLSRLSRLLARPVSGQAHAVLRGELALLTRAFDLELTAKGQDLAMGDARIDAALKGASVFDVSARRDETGLRLRHAWIEATAGRVEANGQLITDDSFFELNAALDDLGRFVDGVNGAVELRAEAVGHDTGWLIDIDGTGPFQTKATARLALPENAQPFVKLSAAVGNVAGFIPDLPGSAEITATARQIGEYFEIDVTGQGSAGSKLTAKGQVRADAGLAEVDLRGSLPLALLNRQLSPNAIQGRAQFDLRVDGPPEISSLSGQVTTSGTRVSLPELRNALTDVNATIALAGGRANVDARADVATGGQIIAKGQLGVTAPFATDLQVQILDGVIRDPDLYETVARGTLTVRGRLPASLNVAGRINLERTEIRVPSAGFGGSGAIPSIVHFNEPRDVRATRSYAGVLAKTQAGGGGGGGPAIGLDVLIAADSRVFVRGRGLDAELGGRFRLTGTTADIIPVGAFDLIRGRLDILGKRLELNEGAIRLLGDFVPNLRLVASRVSEDDVTLRVVIEGRADEPEIRFESEPALPSDEVLARLLFGREIGELSALQAVQLASAVATLAGKGGTGLVERIRQNTGLDDLNVGSDGEGGTTLGLGKYISDNIYTDVVIGNNENSQINLNIDLSRRTKLRGQLESDGGSGIGIFFEKDY